MTQAHYTSYQLYNCRALAKITILIKIYIHVLNVTFN